MGFLRFPFQITCRKSSSKLVKTQYIVFIKYLVHGIGTISIISPGDTLYIVLCFEYNKN